MSCIPKATNSIRFCDRAKQLSKFLFESFSQSLPKIILQYRHNREGKNFFLLTECIRIPFVQSSICLLDANQTLTLQCHKPPPTKPHKFFKHDYEDLTGLVNVNRYHHIQRQLRTQNSACNNSSFVRL